MSEEFEAASSFYDTVAGTYHEQYRREQLFEAEEYPANYFRLQILTTRLADLRVKSLFDIGVGEGTPLVVLASMGIEVAGCDISTQMVEAARRNVTQAGMPADVIGWGDAEDSITLAPHVARGPYDAVTAVGVLPHVHNDRVFLDNVAMLLKPGGRCFIEFRNKLFSLFTFNRHTKEFILDDLLRDRSPETRAAVEAELDRRLETELPRRRGQLNGGEPGYDAILAKFHNPFELVRLFEQAGFSDCRVHWYHFHAALPLLEGQLGERFRRESVAMEHDPTDWRGYFLCSAGVVEATRA